MQSRLRIGLVLAGTMATTAANAFAQRVGGKAIDTPTSSITPGAAMAPPNDECDRGTLIGPGSGSFPYDNTSATTSSDPAPSCGGGLYSKDIWFKWTSFGTGSVTISNCAGPAWDSVITIYSGTCQVLTEVACDDNSCAGPGGVSAPSLVTFIAAPCDAYYIRISSWDVTAGASGSFDIVGPGPDDADQDGTPDCLDACPKDPHKIGPGQCGCGVSDADSDGDGVADCVDPLANFCFPGDHGIRSCPCGNPPATLGVGCNNFGPDPSGGTGGANLAAAGVPSIVDDSLVFQVTSEQISTSGITVLWQGTGTLPLGVQSGAGVRCVAGNLVRLYRGNAPTGSVDFPSGTQANVHTTSAAKGHPILPPVTLHYYAAYRNFGAGIPCGDVNLGFNTTNAGSVFWQM